MSIYHSLEAYVPNSAFPYSCYQRLEECKSQIQSIRNENALVLQSKAILESKLAVSKEACRVAETKVAAARLEAVAANDRIESLSCQLRESHSESECLRHDLQVERQKSEKTAQVTKQVESELKRLKQEKEDAERERDSMKSRAELQDEIVEMRKALKDIRELERVRTKDARRMEAELRCAHTALAKANSAAAETESQLANLRGAVETLQEENGSLRDQLRHTETPRNNHHSLKMEWEAGKEGIEVVAALMDQNMTEATTPRTTSFDQNINLLGAEEGCDRTSKIPLKAAIQKTPDSSSRQLSFSSSTKGYPTDEKENRRNTDERQLKCALCFRPPRPNGTIKRCQCGRDDCNKWACASCLANVKSVSTAVSHPGTPGPSLPTIFCGSVRNRK